MYTVPQVAGPMPPKLDAAVVRNEATIQCGGQISISLGVAASSSPSALGPSARAHSAQRRAGPKYSVPNLHFSHSSALGAEAGVPWVLMGHP